MQVKIDERLRRSLTLRYWSEGIKVLSLVQSPVISLIDNVAPDELKYRVSRLLQTEPLNDYLKRLWINTGSTFAVQTDKRVRIRKEVTGDYETKSGEIDFWEDYFRRYYNERSKYILGEIMDTQTEVINEIIDKVLEAGTNEGLGIGAIQKQLRDEMIEGLTTINKYQAERIARTEVIGASNKGSFEAADKTGLCTGKAWRTSGLPGVRASHAYNESLGEVPMNHVYEGGCKYPGDPSGEVGETVNCRCTHIFNVD